MKVKLLSLFILSSIVFLSCSKHDTADSPDPDSDPQPLGMYFPSMASDEWETVSMAQLNWDTSAEQPLYDFLESRETKGFLILKDGRIAVEEYFGTFTKDSLWYWASAGKTLTSFTLGIAQEQGLLNLNDKSSAYLGEGWTSETLEQENKITVGHQVTMTTGIKDTALNFDCKNPSCLNYEAEAGTRWAYHNGPYTLIQSVISAAAGVTFNSYFNTNLRNKIGMKGTWISTNGSNNVHFSTARDMARFGILNLNDGVWDEDSVLGDAAYVIIMKNTSQNLNKSYGYLWWLNGKQSYMAPGLQTVFNGALIPNAPSDTYAGLGKNDQKLYIVPSQGLVVIRMGEDSGESLLGPSSFDNELWEKINALIN